MKSLLESEGTLGVVLGSPLANCRSVGRAACRKHRGSQVVSMGWKMVPAWYSPALPIPAGKNRSGTCAALWL